MSTGMSLPEKDLPTTKIRSPAPSSRGLAKRTADDPPKRREDRPASAGQARAPRLSEEGFTRPLCNAHHASHSAGAHDAAISAGKFLTAGCREVDNDMTTYEVERGRYQPVAAWRDACGF